MTVSQKERLFGKTFHEDAANRPNVHCTRVLCLSQQNLRSSIPQGLDLMREYFLRHHDKPCQPKISDFYIVQITGKVLLWSTNIFCGLRSRCRILLEWIKAKPLSIFFRITLIFYQSILQSLLMMYFLRSQSQQSNTILSDCSKGLQWTSIKGTMLGCSLRVLSKEIYRSALEGIPSSSPQNLMYLTATYLLFLSTALQTLPNAPQPIVHISLNYQCSFIFKYKVRLYRPFIQAISEIQK